MHQLARTRALSPLATLQRGYAVARRPDGHVLRGAGEVAVDDRFEVRWADGHVVAIAADVRLAALETVSPTPETEATL